MSEYTTVYLRHKEMPLLKNKEYPSHEECQSLSKEDLMEDRKSTRLNSSHRL